MSEKGPPRWGSKILGEGREMQVDGNYLQTLEIRLKNLEKQTAGLEQWQHTFDAVNKERRGQYEGDFKRINARLDKIDGHIGRLIWIVIGAVASAVIAWVINGGLSSVT